MVSISAIFAPIRTASDLSAHLQADQIKMSGCRGFDLLDGGDPPSASSGDKGGGGGGADIFEKLNRALTLELGSVFSNGQQHPLAEQENEFPANQVRKKSASASNHIQ